MVHLKFEETNDKISDCSDPDSFFSNNYPSDVLLPCNYCQRTFFSNSLNRHKAICYKVFNNKAKEAQKKSELKIDDKKDGKNANRLTEVLLYRKNRREKWRRGHIEFQYGLDPLKSSRSDILISNSDQCGTESSDSGSLISSRSDISISNGDQGNSESSDSDESFISDIESEEYSEPISMFNENMKSLKLRKNRFGSNFLSSFENISSLMKSFKHKDIKTSKNIKTTLNSLKLKSGSDKLLQVSSESLGDRLRTKSVSNFVISSKENIFNTDNKNYKNLSVLEKEKTCFDDLSNVAKDEFGTVLKCSQYINRVNRVLKFYNDTYWSQENTKHRKTLDDIPQNLSTQKQNLEKLKIFSIQNSCGNELRLQGLKTNNYDGITCNFKTASRASNNNEVEEKSIFNGPKNNEAYKDGVDSCNLKKESQNIISTEMEIKTKRNYKYEPFTDPKLERFKEHNRNKIKEVRITEPHEKQISSIIKTIDQKSVEGMVSKKNCKGNKINDKIQADSQQISKQTFSSEKFIDTFISCSYEKNLKSQSSLYKSQPNLTRLHSSSVVDNEYKKIWKVEF